METSRWDDPCPGTVGLGSPQKSPVSRLTDCLYTTRRPNPLITLYYNRLWRSEKTTAQTDTMEQNDADYPLVAEGGRRSVAKKGTSDRPTDRPGGMQSFHPDPFPFPCQDMDACTHRNRLHRSLASLTRFVGTVIIFVSYEIISAGDIVTRGFVSLTPDVARSQGSV